MTVTITDLKKEYEQLNAACETLREKMQKLAETMAKHVGEEWPKIGDTYAIITESGYARSERWIGSDYELAMKERGNIYRTISEAKAADDQIQFLRRAMTAGDLAPDADGYGIISRVKEASFLIESPTGWELISGLRKFSTIEARDAFIESEGGIDVFRSKLSKGWPK